MRLQLINHMGASCFHMLHNTTMHPLVYKRGVTSSRKGLVFFQQEKRREGILTLLTGVLENIKEKGIRIVVDSHSMKKERRESDEVSL